MSDDTDALFSDSEEPSSPKEVPYFDLVSAGDWDHLIASLEKNTDQEDLWTDAKPWSKNALGNLEGMPQLSLYSTMTQAIMKKMGYDAQNPIGLGGSRGILIPFGTHPDQKSAGRLETPLSHRQVFIRVGV